MGYSLCHNNQSFQWMPLEPIPMEKAAIINNINIVYGVLSLFAVLCNGLVLAAIVRDRQITTKFSNAFICNLIITDFLLSLIILITSSLTCHFISTNTYPSGLAGLFFCLIIHSKFIIYMLNAVSVATIATISIERYIAVLRPLDYKKIFTAVRIKWIIVIVWLLQPVLTCDYILSVTYGDHIVNNTDAMLTKCSSVMCRHHSLVKDSSSVNYLPLAIIISLAMIRFLLPLLITTFSYVRIGYNSRFQNETFYHRQRTYSSTIIAIRRLTRMASVATVILLLCWIPREIFVLLNHISAIRYSHLIDSITTILVLLKCCLNPFLYAITNKTYRRAVIRLLLRQSSRRESHLRPRPLHIIDRNISLVKTTNKIHKSKSILSNSATTSTLTGSVINGWNQSTNNTLPNGRRRSAWEPH